MIPANIVTNIGIAAIIAVGAFGPGVYLGSKYERSIWLDKEANRLVAEAEAQRKNQELLAELNKQHQENLFKAEKEKESAIIKLKHDYDVAKRNRLYILANCNKTGLSTTTTSVSGTNEGTSSYVELPKELGDKLYEEAYRADELAEDYRALRHWIIYNGMYKE